MRYGLLLYLFHKTFWCNAVKNWTSSDLIRISKKGTTFISKIFLFHHFRKIYLPKCAQLVMTLHRTIQQDHRGQNSKQINIAKYVSKFFIYGAKMLDKCVKSQKKILYIVLLCKVKLSKMASIKTSKIRSTFWISNQNIPDLICNVLIWHSNKDKVHFKDL